MWTKRSHHAPKSGCVIFLNIHPKRENLGFFFMLDLLPFLPHNYSNIWGGGGGEEEEKQKTCLCHRPLIFAAREPHSASLTAKPVGP